MPTGFARGASGAASAAVSGLGGALLLVACASPPGVTLSDFAAAQTKVELVLFMGKTPTSCVPATLQTELCSWRLGNRLDAWHPLARSIETRDRIVVLCELPTDGGPRTSDACTIHPARYLELGPPRGVSSGSRSRGGRPTVDPVAKRTEDERLKDYAERLLEQRVDVVQLSRLMGSAPDECAPGSSDSQLCLWKLSHRDAGWEICARIADSDGRVRLLCELPLDGSPRTHDSCVVHEL